METEEGGLDEGLEDAIGDLDLDEFFGESRPLGDTDRLPETQGMALEQKISRLKRRIAERSLKLI